jgi:hypothetical protein
LVEFAFFEAGTDSGGGAIGGGEFTAATCSLPNGGNAGGIAETGGGSGEWVGSAVFAKVNCEETVGAGSGSGSSEEVGRLSATTSCSWPAAECSMSVPGWSRPGSKRRQD